MQSKGPFALFRHRRGQATIEYVLMLSTVVVLVAAFLTAFNDKIVRWFFMFIGQLLTR